jgi:hypothetical protein
MNGVKHLIQCKCILPQFKTQQIFHKFVVFSIIDGDTVKEKLTQCNNCGAVHKITELCKSTILENRDDIKGIMNIDDYKINLPQNVSELLVKMKCELYVWEEINFIIKNKKWNSKVLLTNDNYDDYKCGKCIIIKNKGDFEIETFNEKITINA